MFFFVKHDSHIEALHKMFHPSTNDFLFPNYAFGFLFELRNDSSGNYYVQVLLKNSKPLDPISISPINIDGKIDLQLNR